MNPQMTLKGWHVMVMLLAFFGAIMTISGVFVAEALRSFPGEDEAKSYAQGLKYNETLRDRAAQAQLGWRAEASLAPAATGVGRVNIRLFDHQGAVIKGARVEGLLRRPTDARLDRPLAFTEVANGEYEASVSSLPEGQWSLHARATFGGSHFDLQKMMLWRTPIS